MNSPPDSGEPEAGVTPQQVHFGYSKHMYRMVDPPRPLNDWERQVLARITSQPFEGRDEVEQQVRYARVDQVCSHCPSVALAVGARSSKQAPGMDGGVWHIPTPDQISGDVESVPRATAGGKPLGGALPCDLAGWDADGMYFEILVLAWSGYIYRIDAWRGDSEPFVELPRPRDMWLRCDIPDGLVPDRGSSKPPL